MTWVCIRGDTAMSTLYTCGRMHKSHKRKRCDPHTSRAGTVAIAVYKIMREELSVSACERWCSRLNAELGPGTFSSSCKVDAEQRGVEVPRVWVPSKPKITMAFLDEFALVGNAEASLYTHKHVGSASAVSKFLAKNAVERLRQRKGLEWLRLSGELTNAQLDDPLRMTHALSRVAFDLLVYVHARAMELKQQSDADVMIELHTSDQTLVGKAMRGCGIVLCENGREVFARAVALVRDALLSQESHDDGRAETPSRQLPIQA